MSQMPWLTGLLFRKEGGNDTAVNTNSYYWRGLCRLVVYHAPGRKSWPAACPDITGERIRQLHRARALTSVCHEPGSPMALHSSDAAENERPVSPGTRHGSRSHPSQDYGRGSGANAARGV